MAENFTKDERAAMRERVSEVRSQAKGGRAKAEADQLAKIAALEEPDRGMAERLHALVLENAPHLTPKTYYGMPGWAKDGKVLCFFQAASKFNTRYGTFGFQENAALDDGDVWPTAFAVAELTPAVEKTLAQLVKKAAG